MAIASGSYRMADRLTGGRLPEVLTAMRSDGLSLHSMVHRLLDDYGIAVTAPTVAKWLRDAESVTVPAAPTEAAS